MRQVLEIRFTRNAQRFVERVGIRSADSQMSVTDVIRKGMVAHHSRLDATTGVLVVNVPPARLVAADTPLPAVKVKLRPALAVAQRHSHKTTKPPPGWLVVALEYDDT